MTKASVLRALWTVGTLQSWVEGRAKLSCLQSSSQDSYPTLQSPQHYNARMERTFSSCKSLLQAADVNPPTRVSFYPIHRAFQSRAKLAQVTRQTSLWLFRWRYLSGHSRPSVLLSFWVRNPRALHGWLYPSPQTERVEATTESSDKYHLGRNRWESFRSTPTQFWDLCPQAIILLFACVLDPQVVQMILPGPHMLLVVTPHIIT